MIHIKTFTFNPFQENTYLLYDDTKEAVLIDPGCYEKYEREELSSFVAKEGLKLKFLLNTHCHIDHVLGNQWAKNTFQIPLIMHEADLPVLASIPSYASNYGFQQYEASQPDRFVDEGDVISFGESRLSIRFVPGHAPGHIVFISEADGFCIAGDTLFSGSIGRTDLPGGDHETLLSAIQEKLYTLADDMVVYPGHGPSTTIGKEKSTNPFVRG
ncbi:MBL fold metallo-hydrolase [Penaeicola halotolerans]|uniref:MBL fold metallo-hydrolase n=1 Tax=Penaeicola halotolerans TaxID=2793196 RepID=UPI001CF92C03|nr:MBL fold metallo-hydrolase [Penaeicola halotolerans]